MRIVSDTLKRVEIGSAQKAANLTLFPLFGGSGRVPDYATLDEAIDGGWLEVGEVSTGGSVPDLKVVNRGGPRGADDGRRRAARGQAEPRAQPDDPRAGRGHAGRAGLLCRAGALGHAQHGDEEFARRAVRQGAPGEDARGLGQLQAHAPADLGPGRVVAGDLPARRFDGRAEPDRRGRRHLRQRLDSAGRLPRTRSTPWKGQTGALFAIGGRLVGLELFEHPDLLRKLLGKVVRSFASTHCRRGLATPCRPTGAWTASWPRWPRARCRASPPSVAARTCASAGRRSPARRWPRAETSCTCAPSAPKASRLRTAAARGDAGRSRRRTEKSSTEPGRP